MSSSVPFDMSSSNGTSTENPGMERLRYEAYRWFGINYFTCQVAEVVFRNADPKETDQSLDAKLNTKIDEFPIGPCLDKIENLDSKPVNIARIPGETREKLMAAVGGVIKLGDGNCKHKLAGIIQSCITGKSSGLEHWRFFPPSPPTSEGGETYKKELPPKRQPAQSADIPAHAYTSMLYEWAKQHRVELTWDAKMVSEYNDWEHSVSFRGQTFRATAQLKQEAKHMAAKKACEHFGI